MLELSQRALGALPLAASQSWDQRLTTGVIDVGIVLIVVGILICVYRLIKGPHLADRAMAVDVISVQLIGLVVLFSLRLDNLILFDGILVLSLLGFAGTVAMGQYIVRRRLRGDQT